MRTVIYVQEPTSVAIRAGERGDANVQICRYNQVGVPAVGSHKLDRGIYLIVSSGEMVVDGTGLTIEVLRNDKDTPPDPKASVIALEPGATAASIQQFLEVAKGISAPDAPDASAYLDEAEDSGGSDDLDDLHHDD
jgi:hypothetical protein